MTQQKDPKKDADLRLSPSEQLGYSSATGIAGSGARSSTQRALASVTLGFELIVVFLVGLAIFGLRLLDPPELGIIAGVAVCGLCILALALMRRTKIGIYIGWAVQAIVFLGGFFLTPIFAVALMFGSLWVYCMIKGAKIDRERALFASL
ncbi:DUF4233 domain-containing protein [Canibacter sp. lx-72]|uniref:DUF4233 domain-containing protein n=1 Tax=Canibacter zhuwentaonis TaxID=2837491 RepID=UPI001BDD1ED0|nr:DUF4233 domain-containing protein [Canibacter zhuwentaonis]MBT1018487.1 DUF4233 domain-containing protein [Canibacter zhuwentaonis]